MKKTLLLITLTLFLSGFTQAQQTLTQYFEGADTSLFDAILVNIDTGSSNIWQIGRPQKTVFDSASTLPNAIVTDTLLQYPTNTTSRFTAKIYNQWWWGIMALQWKQKLDIDSTGDGAIIEFTTDHGTTWQNAFNNPFVYNFYGFEPGSQDTLTSGEYVLNGTDTTWRDVWLCFDMSWVSTFPDTILFRFTFKSDSINTGKDGWMIDNMMAHITIIHTAKSTVQTDYINVYPNPSGNIVHIEAEKLEDFHIIEHMELINSQGKVVQHWQNLPTKFWFDVSNFADGNYTLKVKTNVNSATIPIVVCKN
jgi:Secretion system C-terminal sorting domain